MYGPGEAERKRLEDKSRKCREVAEALEKKSMGQVDKLMNVSMHMEELGLADEANELR